MRRTGLAVYWTEKRMGTRALRQMLGLRAPMYEGPLAPAKTCQWIEGEATRVATFCGAPSIEGYSYCAEHKAHCYTIRSRRELSEEERTRRTAGAARMWHRRKQESAA